MYTLQELTAADKLVIENLMEGLTIKQIAAKTRFKQKTIESRLNSLRVRYGCRNTLELIATLVKDHYEITIGKLLLKRELNNLKVA